MKFLAHLLTIAFLLAITPAIAQDDSYYGGFDGRWEGTLEFVAAEAYDAQFGYKTKTGPFAFAIKGDTVSVYSNFDNKGWREAMPGGFRFAAHKTNGIIFGQQSSVGEEGGKPTGWVETWNFTFTHKDEKSLFVLYTRIVHNLGEAYDHRSPDGTPGRFFTIAHGEFSRTGDVKVP